MRFNGRVFKKEFQEKEISAKNLSLNVSLTNENIKFRQISLCGGEINSREMTLRGLVRTLLTPCHCAPCARIIRVARLLLPSSYCRNNVISSTCIVDEDRRDDDGTLRRSPSDLTTFSWRIRSSETVVPKLRSNQSTALRCRSAIED